jgi:hypothetical protein
VDENQKKWFKIDDGCKNGQNIELTSKTCFHFTYIQLHFVVKFCAVFLIHEVLLVDASCYRSNIEDDK